MERIEDMENMREQVDRLSENDSNKSSIHELAKRENQERERIKDFLYEKRGIQETLGSETMNEEVSGASDSFLETAEALEKAMVDPLTGLHSRRAYEEDIPNNLAIVYKREKQECCYLLLDLDFFKNINETFGYEAGDTVLKEVASLIKGSFLRESDIAYRRGGEEFVVFLPNSDLQGARKVAERIREIVERHVFKVVDKKGQPVELKNIRVSIGCSSTKSPAIHAKSDKEEIFKELEREANVALSAAKETGKNKTVTYSEELEKKNANVAEK